PAYDLLNVRYLVAPADPGFEQRALGEALPGDFQLLGRFDEGLALYRRRETLPRARVLYAAEAVGGAEEAFARLAEPAAVARSDPRRVALVEGPALENPIPQSPAEARIAAYRGDSVEIVADAAAD